MANLAKFFNTDFFRKSWELIQHNGGIKRTLYLRFLKEGTLKTGTLVGTDAMGNQYFENNNYKFGSNRWVRAAPQTGGDFEASMIPVEWYGWMHYKTDVLPTVEASHVQEFMPYVRNSATNAKVLNLNPTGTAEQYVPYSTTKPKIEAWVPPKRA